MVCFLLDWQDVKIGKIAINAKMSGFMRLENDGDFNEWLPLDADSLFWDENAFADAESICFS